MVALRMTERRRSVAILTRKDYMDVGDVVVSLIEKLHASGFKIYLVASLNHRLAETVPTVKDLKRLSPDMLVTVGGDGTLLWAFKEMDDGTPVLGVNVGRRGVLSEVRPADIDKAVEMLRDGKYLVEERMRISASTGVAVLPPVLNEVYLNRISQTRTSTYTIFIDRFTVTQKMDGVMISTPTGSTGHALSLGGPFVSPVTPVFLVMPVASLNRLPPMILPAEPVEIVSDHDSVLALDGQEEVVVKASEKVVIKKHSRNARFIRFEDKKMRQLQNLGLLS